MGMTFLGLQRSSTILRNRTRPQCLVPPYSSFLQRTPIGQPDSGVPTRRVDPGRSLESYRQGSCPSHSLFSKLRCTRSPDPGLAARRLADADSPTLRFVVIANLICMTVLGRLDLLRSKLLT